MRQLCYDEINSKLQRALKSAIASAVKSKCCFRHGACLFKGETFKSAHNSTRPVAWVRGRHMRRVNRIFKHCGHAEVMALHNTPADQIRGADIMVCRINHDNTLMMSMPCEMCRLNMSKLGVRRVYYTIDSEFIGVMKLQS